MVGDFPVSSQDVNNQTLPGRDGKIANLLLQCIDSTATGQIIIIYQALHVLYFFLNAVF